MKKRLMVMLMALCMIVIAVGCGKDNKKKDDESDKKSGYKTTEEGAVYNDYVKIKQWKGFEIEKVEAVVVTDEILEMSIKSDYSTIGELEKVEVKNREAKMGDQVTISYVGKIDGVAFEGGTSPEDTTFVLGQADFIEGFQEGIVGHKSGETFDVPVTFPTNYRNADVAGKDAVFTMTLKKVEEEVLPELTDEIVQQLNPNVKTVEEYKAQMKANLEENYKQQAEATMRSNLLTLMFEQCEVTKYDEKELKAMTESVKTCFGAQLEYLVYMNTYMSLADYLAASGATEDEMATAIFGGTYEELAKHNLKQQYAYDLIMEVEKIEYTDDDYQKFLEEEGELSGYTASEFEEAYESSYGTGSAKLFFLQTKITDFMLENCTIVEPTETEAVTE